MKKIPSNQKRLRWGGKTKQKSVQRTFGPPHKRATVSILAEQESVEQKSAFLFSPLTQMYIFLFREVRASVRIYIWSTRIGFTRDKEVVRYSISTTPPFEIINSASCSFKSGPCMTFNTRASALPFLTQSRIVEA